MPSIPLAEAKTHFSELVDRAAAGDVISITRRGKPVAQLSAAASPRKRISPASLRAVTETMPQQGKGAGNFVRDMRDGDRW